MSQAALLSESPLRICHVVDSLDPAVGGPPAVALHLASEQASAGHRPFILHSHAPGREAEVDRFVEEVMRGGACPRLVVPAGRRAAAHGVGRQRVEQAVHDADIIHIHGVWSRLILQVGRTAEAAGRPYILRPAGMFEPWSMAQKRMKKRLAMALGFRRLVDRAAALHATADQEAEQFRRLGFANPAVVIANGVDARAYDPPPDRGAVDAAWPALRGRRIALFMSRVHPKKGLPFLVEAMQRLGGKAAGWHAVIAGPDADGHAKQIADQAEALGVADRVLMTGPVYGAMKIRLMQAASLFVLPTHSENFGVVVAEAMAARLPVITTTGTPWRELGEHGCGWWIDIGTDPLVAAMEEALAKSPAELEAMGRIGRQRVERRYAWSAIGEACERMYRWLLGRGEPPESLYDGVGGRAGAAGRSHGGLG